MKRLLFVVLLLAGAAVVPSGPAQAAACSGTSGVTVVVDYDDGSIDVRCAPGDPTSGYDALKRAGFQLTFATGNGAGALCSINHVPDHACTSMPGTQAYWAYFHAKPGGTWAYSTFGGGSYDPKPGSVEGWHWQGSPTDPPGIRPPGVAPSPTPTSKPRSTASAHPTGGATSKPTSGSSGVAGPGSTPTAPDASSSTGSTSAPTADVTATATDDVTQAPNVSGSAPTDSLSADRKTDDGSSSGRSWILGLVLVGLLGTAAGVTALRRRRS